MSLVTAPKRTRGYDASGRQERARRQHEAALDAARTRFLDHGYAATTVESIAGAARVSAATIYKSYGGKAGLIRALCQQALAGSGPAPAGDRAIALRPRSDPVQVIEGWARLTAEVAARMAPFLLVLRDAARVDPEAGALAAELDQSRLARMAENGRYLAFAGHLRPGVTASDARDVLWLCGSPELFDLLVNRRGWSLDQFSHFVADTMTNALL